MWLLRNCWQEVTVYLPLHGNSASVGLNWFIIFIVMGSFVINELIKKIKPRQHLKPFQMDWSITDSYQVMITPMTAVVKNYCYPSRIHWGMGSPLILLTLFRWLCSWSFMKSRLGCFPINYKMSTQLANFKKIGNGWSSCHSEGQDLKNQFTFPKNRSASKCFWPVEQLLMERTRLKQLRMTFKGWRLIIPHWFMIFKQPPELRCHKQRCFFCNSIRRWSMYTTDRSS